MSAPAHKKRLVRITFAFCDEQESNVEEEDSYTVDAIVDETGCLSGSVEMFGYSTTHVGTERRKRFDLFKLRPDYTHASYEVVIDAMPGKPRKPRQIEHVNRISKDFCACVGAEFILSDDFDYRCVVTEVIEIMEEKA